MTRTEDSAGIGHSSSWIEELKVNNFCIGALVLLRKWETEDTAYSMLGEEMLWHRSDISATG